MTWWQWVLVVYGGMSLLVAAYDWHVDVDDPEKIAAFDRQVRRELGPATDAFPRTVNAVYYFAVFMVALGRGLTWPKYVPLEVAWYWRHRGGRSGDE